MLVRGFAFFCCKRMYAKLFKMKRMNEDRGKGIIIVDCNTDGFGNYRGGGTHRYAVCKGFKIIEHSFISINHNAVEFILRQLKRYPDSVVLYANGCLRLAGTRKALYNQGMEKIPLLVTEKRPESDPHLYKSGFDFGFRTLCGRNETSSPSLKRITLLEMLLSDCPKLPARAGIRGIDGFVSNSFIWDTERTTGKLTRKEKDTYMDYSQKYF